jgi:hypothetical protein
VVFWKAHILVQISPYITTFQKVFVINNIEKCTSKNISCCIICVYCLLASSTIYMYVHYMDIQSSVRFPSWITHCSNTHSRLECVVQFTLIIIEFECFIKNIPYPFTHTYICLYHILCCRFGLYIQNLNNNHYQITVTPAYTECPRRKGPNFGRVFLRSNYTEITQNTYIQSSRVTEILAREKCGLLWCLRTVLCPWRHTRHISAAFLRYR